MCSVSDLENLTTKSCSVLVHTSIKDIERTEWDGLAHDVYMSHGWLQIMEETFVSPVDHRYFLARVNGILIGSAVCHIQYPTGGSFTLDDAIFGRFKGLAARLGLSVLPSLICGPLRGYGQHFALQEDLTLSDRQAVALSLFEALEREAASLHLSISFNNVMVEERELIQLLEERSFSRTINFPLNYLDIQWKNFDEYKKFLSKRKLVREINKNRKEGVRITQLATVGSCEGQLYKLLNDNYVKYNGKPLLVRSDFISLCKKYLGAEAIIYVAVKGGKIIGTIIMFHRKGIAYVTDVGVDHKVAGNDFTYFNLTYYSPTRDAIAMQIKRLYYGTLMYTMKSKRGCSTLEMYLYHKPRFRLLQVVAGPLFAFHLRFKTWFINRFYM
jgi:predicted N-acyltransferase